MYVKIEDNLCMLIFLGIRRPANPFLLLDIFWYHVTEFGTLTVK